MKITKGYFLLILLLASCAGSHNIMVTSDDFINDFASENNRVAGTLLLDVYPEGLDSLRYEAYVDYLAGNEAQSARGLASKIKQADSHFFKAKKDGFLVLLYYQSDGIILGDNSATAFIDTVVTVKAQGPKPSIEEVAAGMSF